MVGEPETLERLHGLIDDLRARVHRVEGKVAEVDVRTRTLARAPVLEQAARLEAIGAVRDHPDALPGHALITEEELARLFLEFAQRVLRGEV